MLRLHPSALDYAILAVYFLVVLGIGVVARLSVKTDADGGSEIVLRDMRALLGDDLADLADGLTAVVRAVAQDASELATPQAG